MGPGQSRDAVGRHRLPDQGAALRAADRGAVVSVLHDAALRAGQHLLPRQRRGELSHLGHVLDDAVRRIADRRLLLAPAVHQPRLVPLQVRHDRVRPDRLEAAQLLPLQPVDEPEAEPAARGGPGLSPAPAAPRLAGLRGPQPSAWAAGLPASALSRRAARRATCTAITITITITITATTSPRRGRAADEAFEEGAQEGKGASADQGRYRWPART